MNILKKIYDWMGKQVHSAYATPMLAFFFFIEASFFFVPVDPILILYCLEHRKKAWYFATVATSASVIGGLFGYAIGLALWQTLGQLIVTYIISPITFAKAVSWFAHYENLAVLVAGFTPVPYKAVTIGAGFCKLSLAPFIFYSIIARGARFYLLAFILSIWGTQIKDYIDRYFNLLAMTFVILLVGGIWAIEITS